MTYQQTLEDLSLGEVSAEEGLAIVRFFLEDNSPASSRRVYEALRSWLWKALWTRRTDDGLRQWISLLSFAAHNFEQSAPALSPKVEVLTELLRASIRKGESERNEDPLTRKHVAEMLVLLAEQGGRASRHQLRATLGIKPANLTRIMGPLVDRGYVDVERRGREISYRITRKGHALLPASTAMEAAKQPSLAPREISILEASEARPAKRGYLQGLGSSPLATIQVLDVSERKDPFEMRMKFVGHSSQSANREEKSLA